MKALRTIVWLMAAALFAAFTVANWQPVVVHIWQGLVLETKLPALVLACWLLGFGPMWALHRAHRWRLRRRIASLEANLVNRDGASLSATHLDAVAKGVNDTP